MSTPAVRPSRGFMAAAAALPLALAGSAFGAVIIDDFSDTFAAWPHALDVAGTQVLIDEGGIAGTIGDERRSQLFLATTDVPGLDSVSLAIDPSGTGLLDYSSTAGADGSLSLSYLDLVADLSSELFISLDIVAYDAPGSAPMPVTLDLVSVDGSATATLDASGGPEKLLFFFAGLTTSGNFDLSEISEISLAFDPGVAGDFRLNGIFADVPAPAALPLLAIAALTTRRRRR